jgi:hypothetical protein
MKHAEVKVERKSESSIGLRKMRGGNILLEPCGNCGCRRYSKCNCTVGVKKS